MAPGDPRRPPSGWRFARFLLAGAVCSLLGLGVLWLLTGRWGVNYLVSTVIAFLLINPVGYVLNGRLTFGGMEKRWFRQLLKYYGVMATSLLLNLAMTALLVEVFGVHYLVANATATVLAVLLNFLGHSSWTFRGAAGGSAPPRR